MTDWDVYDGAHFTAQHEDAESLRKHYVIIYRAHLPEVKVEPNGDLHVGGWTLSVDEPTTWDDVLAMVAAYEWAQKNPPVDERDLDALQDLILETQPKISTFSRTIARSLLESGRVEVKR